MRIFSLSIKLVSITILGCMILCGCQKNPQDVVANNTSTTSDENIQQVLPAAEPAAKIHKSFESTDGSVRFELNIQTDTAISSLPTVKVQPHYLTKQDAQQTAHALFGDAAFYEREPYESATFSKTEIQDRLQRWSGYIGNDALYNLYGTEDIDFVKELVQKYIREYTLKLETASNENTHIPCKWEYKEDCLYTFAPDNITPEELASANSAILANCTVNGIRYCFDAVTRNKSDYKLNIISAYIDGSNSPFGIDEAIARATLCRTGKPEQSQVNAISQKAENILGEIGIGQWIIDSCTLQEDTIGNKTEYSIRVNALPVLAGARAVDCSPFFKLKGEDVYASNYYLTSAQFTFAPDGTLLSFELTSPIDIIEIGEQTEVASSTDEMIARGINQLSLTDYYAFYTGDTKKFDNISVLCNVGITGGYYGLVRTKIANQDDQYQYIPSFVLTGTYDFSNPDTGDLYMSKDEEGILLALNAADGTVLIAPGA